MQAIPVSMNLKLIHLELGLVSFAILSIEVVVLFSTSQKSRQDNEQKQ